jgi:hypothetical protein
MTPTTRSPTPSLRVTKGLTRYRLAAMLATSICLATAACGGHDTPPLSAAAQSTLVNDLQNTVAEIPGIVNPDVSYHPGAVLEPSRLTISFDQPTGPAADPIVDQITRLAWTSKLQPVEILRITSGVYGTVDFTDRSSSWTDAVVKAHLTRKYGPRPGTSS